MRSTYPRAFPRLILLALLILASFSVTLSGWAQFGSAQSRWLRGWRSQNHEWVGIHLMLRSDKEVDALIEELPKFATLEVNVIIAEVNYNYDFKSHPELRMGAYISQTKAHQLAQAAHTKGIRLIPMFNCLGHQSWAGTTFPLLTKYPQFDETPGQYPGNTNIYCRSWCPQNPDVNPVVFSLIDELIEGFEADAFHVGMDEVFLIASEHCERCRGTDPSALFAKAVKDLHQHIKGKRKLEMMMWGDRLLDADILGYSEWEASKNKTYKAVDLIPKDIIICDWHYEKRENYPSVPFLLQKGFRVWASGWQPVEASRALSAYARTQKHKRNLGYLATTWGKVGIRQMADWPPLTQALEVWTTLVPRN